MLYITNLTFFKIKNLIFQNKYKQNKKIQIPPKTKIKKKPVQ